MIRSAVFLPTPEICARAFASPLATSERGDIHSAENIESDLGADTAHSVDQQPEKLALLRRNESVQDMSILANRQVGQ